MPDRTYRHLCAPIDFNDELEQKFQYGYYICCGSVHSADKLVEEQQASDDAAKSLASARWPVLSHMNKRYYTDILEVLCKVDLVMSTSKGACIRSPLRAVHALTLH